MKTYQIITNSSCNLRCTYCYEYLDAKQNAFANIKPYLDTVVAKGAGPNNTACTIDFIGGEPFFVPDLLEEIMHYCLVNFKQWGYHCLHFLYSTNGTLLHKPKQMALLKKYRNHLSLGISIDGDKAKHDKHRLTIGGKGSFDEVVKGIEAAKQYLTRDQISLKATFTKDSIGDYARSMKFLYSQYGNDVFSIQGNFNFEERFDVYDGTLIANETMEVARYLQSNDYYAEFMFKFNHKGEHQSMYLHNALLKPISVPLTSNRCGSCMHMTSLGYDGKLYGCNRFSTMKKDGMELGAIEDGQHVDYRNPLVDKVKEAYKEAPPWCQTCRFNKDCSDCVAIPIDEGLDYSEYYYQNRMCGYTKASAVAKLYNQLLFIQRSRRHQYASDNTHHE